MGGHSAGNTKDVVVPGNLIDWVGGRALATACRQEGWSSLVGLSLTAAANPRRSWPAGAPPPAGVFGTPWAGSCRHCTRDQGLQIES